MTPSTPQWEALVRRYRLAEQAEWRKLLKHFALTSGFDFVVLLVPDDDGALLCRHELEKHFAETGSSLLALDVHTPADLRRLPEWFLDTPCPPGTACLWLQGVAPDYTKDYAEWRGAWQHTLARLNTFRNPIRDKFGCTLLFAGAPWLQKVLRETAPDLWSVRTTVVNIEAVPQSDIVLATKQTRWASAEAQDSPDPEFALRQAEKLRGVLGKELELATLLYRAGQGFSGQSNWREAEKSYSEALELQQHHNAPPDSLLVTLNDLAWACFSRGKARMAMGLAKQALDLSQAINDKGHEVQAFRNLGNAFRRMGALQLSIECHNQSLKIAREIGDRHNEGMALGNIGNAYRRLGDVRKAIEFHEQHLAIARAISDQFGESDALWNLGLAFAALGDMGRAISFYEQHLTTAHKISDRRGEAAALGNIGSAYLQMGQTQRATDFLEQQLVIVREIGDHAGEAHALWNMSLVMDESGKRELALALAQEALGIFEHFEDANAAKVRAKLAEWQGEVETPA